MLGSDDKPPAATPKGTPTAAATAAAILFYLTAYLKMLSSKTKKVILSGVVMLKMLAADPPCQLLGRNNTNEYADTKITTEDDTAASAGANATRTTAAGKAFYVSTSTNGHETMLFDSDLVPIRIDNSGATKSVWRDKSQFVGPLTQCRAKFNGMDILCQGTLRLRIDDDNGVSHTKDINGVYFMPELSCNILSPQQWAQSAKDNRPRQRDTYCTTYENALILHWDRGRFKRTIIFDPSGSNAVATAATAPATIIAGMTSADATTNLAALETVKRARGKLECREGSRKEQTNNLLSDE
jgi:hypothetical protein